MKHPRKLVEDKDYVPLEKGSVIWTPGGMKYSRRLWKVYLLNSDEEAYICPDCFKYTSDIPRGIVGHLKVHANGHSAGTAHHARTREEMRREARAFRLLPKKVQRIYLAKLADLEIPEAEEDHDVETRHDGGS